MTGAEDERGAAVNEEGRMKNEEMSKKRKPASFFAKDPIYQDYGGREASERRDCMATNRHEKPRKKTGMNGRKRTQRSQRKGLSAGGDIRAGSVEWDGWGPWLAGGLPPQGKIRGRGDFRLECRPTFFNFPAMPMKQDIRPAKAWKGRTWGD